jgi:hypothetical protein
MFFNCLTRRADIPIFLFGFAVLGMIATGAHTPYLFAFLTSGWQDRGCERH